MKKSNLSRTLDILLTFLKFGCFTFGGGWSIIAQIQKEYVEKKKWITDEELLDFTAVGRSVPGLMIGNVSIFFGYHTAGVTGALAALIGMVIPPFIIMIVVVYLYSMFKDNAYVASAMIGVRAAVVPIIINALIKLFKSGMKDVFCYITAICAFSLSLFFGWNNIIIVLLGAASGLAYREVKSRNDLL